MDEIWKDIEGYEGLYKVSNLGNILSTNFNKQNISKNLKLHLCKFGYVKIDLQTPTKKKKSLFVHRLVAEAFIPNTNNYREINHIDGNKTNNMINNLEWITRSKNVKHAYDTGLKQAWHKGKRGVLPNGSNKPQSKLTETDILKIIELYLNGGYTFHKLAYEFGVGKTIIGDIIKGKAWTYVTNGKDNSKSARGLRIRG